MYVYLFGHVCIYWNVVIYIWIQCVYIWIYIYVLGYVCIYLEIYLEMCVDI